MQSWHWLIIMGVLVVFYIMLMVRQKRQQKQQAEALNNFKVGDKVITHIGVFGRIKRIYNTTYGKICVLEVGVNNKVDTEIDLRYIAGIDEKTIAPEDPVKVENTPIKEETKNEEMLKNEEATTKTQEQQSSNRTKKTKKK